MAEGSVRIDRNDFIDESMNCRKFTLPAVLQEPVEVVDEASEYSDDSNEMKIGFVQHLEGQKRFIS